VCDIHSASRRGAKAAKDFSNSWGIGVGLSQISDAQGVVTSAMQALLVITILEALWLVANGNWVESYIDFVSVHATVLASRSRLGAVLAEYKMQSYAVA
jgi:hypothetical protein